MVITPILTTPYLTRVLGPEKIGKDAYANSFVQIFLVFVLLGIASYGKKRIAVISNRYNALSENGIKKLRLEFTSIYIIQFTSMLLMSLFYIVSVHVFFEDSIIFYLYTFMILAYGLDISWYFIAREKVSKIMNRTMLIKFITIISIFVFVKSESDLAKYVFINCFLLFVGQGYMWLYLFKEIKHLHGKWKMIKKHLKPVCMIAVIPIVTVMYISLNKMILGSFIGETAVGFFNQAYKIYTIGFLFVQALSAVVMPALISHYVAKDHDLFLKKIQFFYKYICFTVMPICFLIIGIAKNFVNLFLGRDFSQVSPTLMIIIFTLFFSAISDLIGGQIMIITGQNREYIFSGLIGSSVSILTNLVLINSLHEMGTAVAFLVGNIVIALTQVYLIKINLSLREIIKMAIPYTVAGLLIYGAAFISSYIQINNLFLLISVQCMICLIVYILFLAGTKNEIFIYLLNNRKAILHKRK